MIPDTELDLARFAAVAAEEDMQAAAMHLADSLTRIDVADAYYVVDKGLAEQYWRLRQKYNEVHQRFLQLGREKQQ